MATEIERLSGKPPIWYEAKYANLFGCGSILDNVPQDFKGILLGTGSMYAVARPDLMGADVRALRGPLTAALIDEDLDVPYGDLGLLFHSMKNGVAEDKKYKVGHLPHYAVNKPQAGRRINVLSGIRNVVEEVGRCERLRSSSLHGIILADALGIENMWIQDDAVCGDGFKFIDYGASLEEDIQPNVWRLGDQARIVTMATELRGTIKEMLQQEDYHAGTMH